MTYHAGFTPRQFPIDPFDHDKPCRLPWSLDTASLPDHRLLAKQRNVILLLGEPPLDALVPLLFTPNLAASLLILATSRAYSMPPSVSPDVRILHLTVPLASSDSPASRFADVLQWAARTAAAWRASPSPPPFEELAEDGTTVQVPGYQTPPLRASWFGTGSSSALSSPASSELALARKYTPPIRTNSTPDTSWVPTQRAFDAILDFLPPDAPDRHLLKHAILVTTLARPFLAAPDSTPPPPSTRPSSRRFSLRARQPVLPPSSEPVVHPKAHIVHLIPPARATLVRPLESFCLSFSFPVRGALDMPRPYVMPPAALGDTLRTPVRSWSLVELILCGALDGEHAPTSLRSLAKSNRAWIKGIADISLDGSRRLSHSSAKTRSTLSSIVRPSNPQPFYSPDPDDLPTVPFKELPPRPRPISTATSTSESLRVSTSLPSSPASTSPRQPSSIPASLPPTPHRSNSERVSSVISAPMPMRSRTMSAIRTVAPVPANATVKSFMTVKSVWPTPPSSPSSSSPSSSPELRDVAEGKPGLQRAGAPAIAETEKRANEGKEAPLKDGATKQRRRRIFAWITR